MQRLDILGGNETETSATDHIGEGFGPKVQTQIQKVNGFVQNAVRHGWYLMKSLKQTQALYRMLSGKAGTS